MLKLFIGNKNYSSWSMRPWVLMRQTGIAFQEVMLRFDSFDSGSTFKAGLKDITPVGKVPVLTHEGFAVWDTLAIAEYLAEQFPEQHLWPQDVAARATARSVCAEMHSGFAGLRSAMSMNIKAYFPGRGRTAAAQADIGRISEIWEDCLSRYGHHEFLFGDFSIADAFFAPVVMRFRSYGVVLAPALNAYCDRISAHPAVARWVREALAETESAAKHDIVPD